MHGMFLIRIIKKKTKAKRTTAEIKIWSINQKKNNKTIMS